MKRAGRSFVRDAVEREQTPWKVPRQWPFGMRQFGLRELFVRRERTVGGSTSCYHQTLQNAVVAGGWLKRRQDGDFPSQCAVRMAALHTAAQERDPPSKRHEGEPVAAWATS